MTQLDMSVYMLVHNGIRQEFGLLAKASKSVRNDAHRALIESQIDLCEEVLRLHHHEEDTWLFPTLMARIPECEPGIMGLLADHRALDHIINEVGDTSCSLEERAPAMCDLHALLGEHLEREERDAIPLMHSCITEDEWDVSVHRPLNSIPRHRLPLAFGWLSSANSEADMRKGMNSMPLLVRAMFKMAWAPSYRRRAFELYS